MPVDGSLILIRHQPGWASRSPDKQPAPLRVYGNDHGPVSHLIAGPWVARYRYSAEYQTPRTPGTSSANTRAASSQRRCGPGGCCPRQPFPGWALGQPATAHDVWKVPPARILARKDELGRLRRARGQDAWPKAFVKSRPAAGQTLPLFAGRGVAALTGESWPLPALVRSPLWNVSRWAYVPGLNHAVGIFLSRYRSGRPPPAACLWIA